MKGPDDCKNRLSAGGLLQLHSDQKSGNGDNGVINLIVKGASGKYKLHLIGDSPGKNQLNLKENQINNLSSGVYDIVLQDPEGCTKAIKVSIN